MRCLINLASCAGVCGQITARNPRVTNEVMSAYMDNTDAGSVVLLLHRDVAHMRMHIEVTARRLAEPLLHGEAVSNPHGVHAIVSMLSWTPTTERLAHMSNMDTRLNGSRASPNGALQVHQAFTDVGPTRRDIPAVPGTTRSDTLTIAETDVSG